MASIPKGVLLYPNCRKMITAINEKAKTNVMIYTSAFVLIVEVLSATILRDTIKEGCNPFFYVLLTQLVLFMVYINFNYNRILLKYCQRQIIIIRTLMVYYLFGVISLIFSIPENTYTNIIKYSLLGIVFIVTLLTIYKNKK